MSRRDQIKMDMPEAAAFLADERTVTRATTGPHGQPPAAELPPQVGEMVDKQAAKRVALEFAERRRASWDHRKLGGTY
jgi:hypothetical protein